MTPSRDRSDVTVAGSLLVVALLLGGGSALFPLFRLLVELCAVVVLAWFCIRPWRTPEGLSAKVAIALLTATTLLLVVQVVPLPPSIWHDLPARGDALAVYAAIGAADHWAPISLNPSATRDTIAFFLVPVAIFAAAMRIGREGQRKLLELVAILCLLNAVLVMVQFQALPNLTFYSSYDRPGTALFANKNHSALFLVAGMPAVAWAIQERWPKASPAVRRWVALAATGLLSLSVFGCLSRAGLALLPIGIVLSLAIVAPRVQNRRRTAIALGAAAAAVLMMVVILPRTTVVSQAMARFDATSDLRYLFWPVVADGIGAYFPVGSGFGTFGPVFAALEPLSIVKPTFVNHAHSDYMEIALEGGIVAIGLVACFILWFGCTAVMRLRASRWGRPDSIPVAIAVAGVAVLLLHSVLDYPLRTLALASLAALYCAILATRPSALDLREPSRYRRGARTKSGRPDAARSSPEFQ